MSEPRIFVSYSHKDSVFKEQLAEELRSERYRWYSAVWTDSELEPGEKWLPRIEVVIASASVGVLLISQDFLDLWL